VIFVKNLFKFPHYQTDLEIVIIHHEDDLIGFYESETYHRNVIVLVVNACTYPIELDEEIVDPYVPYFLGRLCRLVFSLKGLLLTTASAATIGHRGW
jgi:hypothetical protein